MSERCECCERGYAQVTEVCWADLPYPERAWVAIACTERGFGHVVPPTLGNRIVAEARARHGLPPESQSVNPTSHTEGQHRESEE